jgi:hypothetical protein
MYKRVHLHTHEVSAIFSARCDWNCPNIRRRIAKILSKQYNVTPKTVRDIWNGKTWTGVTGMPQRRGCIDNVLFRWTRTEFIDRKMLACTLSHDLAYLKNFTFEY